MSERLWSVPVPPQAGKTITVTHGGLEPQEYQVEDGYVYVADEAAAQAVARLFDAQYYPPDAEELPPSTVDEEESSEPVPPAAVLGEIEDKPMPADSADETRPARERE